MTDTKPGSYEEFHAKVLNQIMRFYEHIMEPTHQDIPVVHQLLAQDIAGNLWQGCIQEKEALIRELVEALEGWVSPIPDTPVLLAEFEKDLKRAEATLRHAKAAGYGEGA